MVCGTTRTWPDCHRTTDGALTMRLWPRTRHAARVAVILGLVSGLATISLLIDIATAPTPVVAQPGGVRSYVDPIERCEYLIYDSAVGGHIVPRRTAEGEQRCAPSVINNKGIVRML